MAGQQVLRTSVVGSYCQPEWLIDRTKLKASLPPRVRRKEIWRIDEDQLEAAQDAATLLAIRDQEEAGLDVITDGEIRRESYSNRFATAVEGMDTVNHGTALDRTGHANPVPRVCGPLRRARPVQVRDMEFLRRHARPGTKLKMTLPGPFTMAQQCQDDHYGSREKVAMALAACINEEVRDLFSAGADIVQLDEPYVQARPEEARKYAVAAIDKALEGFGGPGKQTALHVCFGYAQIHKERGLEKPAGYSFLPELDRCKNVDEVSIEVSQPKVDLSVLADLPSKRVAVGLVDMSRDSVKTCETAGEVADRIRAALKFLPAERLVVSQDCGMKYMSREAACAKMRVMVDAAATVRAEVAAGSPDAKRARLQN